MKTLVLLAFLGLASVSQAAGVSPAAIQLQTAAFAQSIQDAGNKVAGYAYAVGDSISDKVETVVETSNRVQHAAASAVHQVAATAANAASNTVEGVRAAIRRATHVALLPVRFVGDSLNQKFAVISGALYQLVAPGETTVVCPTYSEILAATHHPVHYEPLDSIHDVDDVVVVNEPIVDHVEPVLVEHPATVVVKQPAHVIVKEPHGVHAVVETRPSHPTAPVVLSNGPINVYKAREGITLQNTLDEFQASASEYRNYEEESEETMEAQS